MASSGSFSTSYCTPASKTWYWDLSWWVTGWNGNTANIHYEVYNRCTSGTSGSTWIANYGFNGSIAGHDFSSSSSFYKDSCIASGDFSLSGGTYFEAWVTAHPYSGSSTSSGSGGWTLDNNVITPTVTVSIGSRTETTIAASMSVTSDGHASIVDHYIDLFTDSGCTNKVGTITGSSGTFTGLTANKTYYARSNASNGTYRGYSSVPSTSTYQYPYITSINTSALTIGNSQTITLYNPLGRSVAVYMKKDNTSGTTLYSKSGATTGTSFTFTPTASTLYNSIPAATSANCVYYCTYSSQTVQTKSGTYKVSGNNAQAPTFSNFDYKDTDPLASQLTGKNGVNNPGVLVSGLSDCIFNITTSQKATSNYGATLDHYNFAWPNGSGTSSPYLSNAEVSNHVYDGNTTTISVTAYDKRGQYKTVSKTITLISPSHATAKLQTTRRNGIESVTYLNGSISYWAGDWLNGSSRPNNFYRVEYTVNNGSTYHDITTAVTSNSTSSTSGKIKTFNLNSNVIQIHANGSSGGFIIGTQYTIQVYIITGVKNGSTYYNYDNRQKVAEIIVNSGTFGMSRFKDNSGDYHYGINCLPYQKGGNYKGLAVRGISEQIVSISSVSNAIISLGIGSGGTNRGIYDLTDGHDGWLIYYNGSRTIVNDAFQANTLYTTDMYIDDVKINYSFSKNLTVSTDWQETGIVGNNLPSGVYAIRISNLCPPNQTWQLSGSWGGIIVWFNGTTNSSDTCEFPLYSAHHANNGVNVYIRTIGSPNTDSRGMRLQIKGSTAFANSNISFKFTKLV